MRGRQRLASSYARASVSSPSNGWNEAHSRASNYGFTNGVINTNPTIGGSALSQNRATFMPEPRIGVAYDVFGNGKTALRANFGVHRALLDALDYRLDQTAPFNTTLSFSNTTVDKLPEFATGTSKGADRSHPAMCSRTLLPRRCLPGLSRSSNRSPRPLRSLSAMWGRTDTIRFSPKIRTRRQRWSARPRRAQQRLRQELSSTRLNQGQPERSQHYLLGLAGDQQL